MYKEKYFKYKEKYLNLKQIKREVEAVAVKAVEAEAVKAVEVEEATEATFVALSKTNG